MRAVQSDFAVQDEEAAVLCIGESVLQEWAVAADVVSTDVPHDAVGIHLLRVEVCGHHQAGAHRDGEGTVAVHGTCCGSDRGFFGCGVERHVAFGMCGRRQAGNTLLSHEVVRVVESPPANGVGQRVRFRKGFVRSGTECEDLLAAEGNVPESNLRSLYVVFLAIVVDEEERACAHSPDGGIGRSGLAHLMAVQVDGRNVVLDDEDDAVPPAGGEGAVVAQAVGVQSQLSVLDEEAAVLLVREVVLIESGIAVELFRADVEHKRVAVEALFLEVSVHHQSGTCGNGDGSVAFSLTCYGFDADGGKVVVERCAARLQDGSCEGGFTCACQQVVGIVEWR